MLTDPVPAAARTELERLGRRWQTLPLAQALLAAPALRQLAQQYADELATHADRPGEPAAQIPDLGPATSYDQLVVLVYEVARSRAGRDRDALVEDLARVRRELP